jgi:hypothetical protein
MDVLFTVPHLLLLPAGAGLRRGGHLGDDLFMSIWWLRGRVPGGSELL